MSDSPNVTSQSTAKLDRRRFLGALTASTALFVSGNAVIHPIEAWGLEATAFKPETMLSLIKIARDIYPHDRLADKFYALAVKGYDKSAATNPKTLALITDGVGGLDAAAKKAHGASYASVGWEAERVKLLQAIETTPFFQTIRGGLVTGLYNQKEIWPLFGYEGESASKGGYINRGFNDLAWL